MSSDSSLEEYRRCAKKRAKRASKKLAKPVVKKKPHKQAVPDYKVHGKKVCKGDITTRKHDGMYLKGLRSTFIGREVLTDENVARRDEDLCRLIDFGGGVNAVNEPHSAREKDHLEGSNLPNTRQNLIPHESPGQLDKVSQRRRPDDAATIEHNRERQVSHGSQDRLSDHSQDEEIGRYQMRNNRHSSRGRVVAHYSQVQVVTRKRNGQHEKATHIQRHKDGSGSVSLQRLGHSDDPHNSHIHLEEAPQRRSHAVEDVEFHSRGHPEERHSITARQVCRELMESLISRYTQSNCLSGEGHRVTVHNRGVVSLPLHLENIGSTTDACPVSQQNEESSVSCLANGANARYRKDPGHHEEGGHDRHPIQTLENPECLEVDTDGRCRRTSTTSVVTHTSRKHLFTRASRELLRQKKVSHPPLKRTSECARSRTEANPFQSPLLHGRRERSRVTRPSTSSSLPLAVSVPPSGSGLAPDAMLPPRNPPTRSSGTGSLNNCGEDGLLTDRMPPAPGPDCKWFQPEFSSTPMPTGDIQSPKGPSLHQMTGLEDRYIAFTEKMDGALAPLISKKGREECDDRRMLCQYFMKRLRLLQRTDSKNSNVIAPEEENMTALQLIESSRTVQRHSQSPLLPPVQEHVGMSQLLSEPLECLEPVLEDSDYDAEPYADYRRILRPLLNYGLGNSLESPVHTFHRRRMY